MSKQHEVESILFDGDTLVLHVDGREHRVDVSRVSRRLLAASAVQRRNYVVSPSGYGVHWPDIDEDLSIDGLLGVKHPIPVLKAAG
jgi:hypothetical protein